MVKSVLGWVVCTNGAHPGLCGMKQLAVFLYIPPSLDEMLTVTSPTQGPPELNLTVSKAYWICSRVEKGTLRMSCLLEHNSITTPVTAVGLKHGLQYLIQSPAQ